MSLRDIIAAQSAWAARRWSNHRGNRAPSLTGNLLIPMTPVVSLEFSRGKGGELGGHGRPGKMQSLRSSSALAYNFFAPWLGHDLSRLAAALGCRVRDSSIAFERTFPHGLGTVPPHMDVTLDNHQARPLGIECKFTEPYRSARNRPPLARRYFPASPGRWERLDLPRCQQLAETLRTHNPYRRLDAGQLLKHILGLAHTTQRPPRLICLWYDTRCGEAKEFQAELTRFGEALDDSIEFKGVTYQGAFAALQGGPEPLKGYYAYLRSRYFAA